MTISSESCKVIRDDQGKITHILIFDLPTRHVLLGTWEQTDIDEQAELIEKGLKQ